MSHRKAVLIGALAAILLAPVVSVKMQKVEVPSLPTVEQMATNMVDHSMAVVPTLAPAEAPTVSLMVPVLTGPNIAGAACDPSEGRHSGIALRCFLEWLMEFTDA